MADVGVIELQIYDNSEQASSGLDALGGALDRVKRSVSGGLKLDGAAKQIENVMNAVNSAKADTEFEKVTSRIEQSVSKMNDKLKIELKEVKDTVTSGFADNTGNTMPGLENVESQVQTLQETAVVYHSVQEAAQALGITEEEVARRAQETFDRIYNSGSGMTIFSSAEEAAQKLGMSMEQVQEECAKTYAMVYGGGSGSGGGGGGSGGGGGGSSGGAFGDIIGGAETARTLIDMLRDKIEILQWEVDHGQTEKGTILSDKAIVNNEIQIEKLTQQVERLQTRMKAGMSVNGADVVSALGDYSQIDLMTMKMEGMRQALAEDINQNRLDSQQIAQRMMRIQELAEKIEQLKQSQEDATKSTKSMSGAYNGFGKQLKAAFPLLDRIRGQLSRIVMRRAIMATIRMFTSGLKEGVENVYNYSKAINGSFAPAMDNAVSAIAQMKNSLGAAVAPLLQSLIPVFQTIISWVITAINYLNQFFALLRGQATWTRALPQTVNAFDKTSKAAKGAGSAIKDLLADWDELNIIQSESGGGGGGATTAAEDYLKMFEEVGEFDNKIKNIVSFIKDNMGDVLKLVKDIGIAVLGWKLANAFTGPLGTLAALVAAGKLIQVTWQVTEKFDDEYVKTGDEGWLVADVLTNIFGATLAGGIVQTVLKGQTGLITAGTDLIISGSISYGIGYANEEKDKADALKKLGMIKAGIGYAALSLGFGLMSGSAAIGLLSAAALAAPMFVLGVAVTVAVKQYETAQEIAKKAFASTGEGGISVADIFSALQDEMTQASSGYTLAIDAFANAPQLKSDISDAFATITNLSATVKGDGKLTQDEANAFKQAWTTVFEAFEGLTADAFETIFTGLNQSLRSENETIREEAKRLRITMLSAKEDISEAMAEFQLEQQGLADKITTGKASEEEIQQYFDNLNLIAQLTKTSTTDFENAIKESSNIDFGDASNAVSNAMAFIRGSSAEAEKAIAEIDAGRDAMLEATEEAWRNIEFAHTRGHIGEEKYKMYEEQFNTMRENFKQAAELNKDKVRTTAENAYRTVIEQALSGIANMEGVVAENGQIDVVKLAAYINEILVPILSAAKEAGYNFDEEFGRMFGIGINPQEWIHEVGFENLVNYIRKEILGMDIGETIENEMEPIDVPVEVDAEVSEDVGKVVRMFEREIKEGMTEEDIQDVIDDAVAMYGEAAYNEAMSQLSDLDKAFLTANVEVEIANVEEVKDTLTESTQEAAEEFGEIGKIFDTNLSENARKYVQEVLNGATMGGGYNMLIGAENYAYGAYGEETYMEVADIIEALIADYEDMLERGFVDTDELNRRYAMYGTEYATPGEGMSVNPEDVSNGVEKGASKANQSVVAALNTLIAAVNRSNSRPVNVTIAPSARMGRMNKQSDMFLEYVIGG